jgi:glycolate oxidase iron-sulfur subunit
VSGLGLEGGAPPAQAGHASLPVIKLDPRTYDRALDCVHCGLCLPACPTYTQNGLEGDSPRGRIMLMKGLATGKVEPTESVINHLDLCLDCRACETACPSGVVYHELIEETRARLGPLRKPTATQRFVEWMFLNVFPKPTLLKLALLPPRVLQKVGLWKPLSKLAGKVLPDQLEKMQQMLPPRGPLWESPLAERYPAAAPDETKRGTVALLSGCIGSVLFQDVNRQSIRLLQHAGCDVIVPRSQGCCGAIHHHAGHHHEAVEMAKRNIDALGDADFVVTNIAGCGAALRDYAFLLRDEPGYAEKAKAFEAKVRDISEMLVHYKLPAPPRAIEQKVTYHDACHLAHGQKVTAPPRELLLSIKGLTLIPLRESEICCGAAGTYNLTQPAMARDLAERKIAHILATGAKTCVTGNVGCAMQIQSESDRIAAGLRVIHPVTLLHEAYFGPDSN